MKQDLKLYYTAPKESVFKDLKKSAIKIWQTYDNQYGYVDEKVNKLKDLKNIADNFMFILAMFDSNNQQKVSKLVKKETWEAIEKRLPSDYLQINWEGGVL